MPAPLVQAACLFLVQEVRAVATAVLLFSVRALLLMGEVGQLFSRLVVGLVALAGRYSYLLAAVKIAQAVRCLLVLAKGQPQAVALSLYEARTRVLVECPVFSSSVPAVRAEETVAGFLSALVQRLMGEEGPLTLMLEVARVEAGAMFA
jgi:hypothetical protein